MRGVPHAGQFSGAFIFILFTRSDKDTRSISGITSPALFTKTISFILISFLVISSILCKLALLTFTPPILTGSNSATGVIVPVLPT